MHDANDPVLEGLRRKRKACDVVALLCLLIGGSNLLWLGSGAPWPLYVMGVCVVIGGASLLLRSRLTKRIWAVDPPAEPLYKRSWPDGT